MNRQSSILWISADESDSRAADVRLGLSGMGLIDARNLEDVADILDTMPIDLIFADCPVAGVSAFEMLAALRERSTSLPVFLRDREPCTFSTTSRLSPDNLTELLSADMVPQQVVQQIEAALGLFSPRLDVREEPDTAWRSGLIGESMPMRQVAELIRLAAPRRCTILISGETGTGKEVVAKAIHAASPRARMQMVCVNCSAIPEALLEAELFGHVRGAFTGAQQSRTGRFEQAHRGTLFLDEIGDMPLDLQAKLLRVLQEREFQRLGSSETIRVDVRIIAASNVDLLARVREGTFREDLYYRLNVLPIAVPALRFRPTDIPMLALHFAGRICRSEGLRIRRFLPEVFAKLDKYSWPGNVRQLENAIEMAVVLSGEREYLTAADFPLPKNEFVSHTKSASQMFEVPEHGLDFQEAVTEFERGILSQALQKTHGNKKLAADMLRLKRTTLSAKVRLLETAAGCPLI